MPAEHRGLPRPPDAEEPWETVDGLDAARTPARHTVIPSGAHLEQVTLRSPAELADALPYLLGYRPEDSIVLVALHHRQGYRSFGARARLGIPERREDWPAVARQLAQCLVTASERRDVRPDGMVAFVCQEPQHGRSGRQVMETLRPLAQLLRTECGSLDIPVLEALCISDGRFWSYCCPGLHCCSPDGTAMGLPGASVLSAALTYAGLQVRGTLKEFQARLLPWETAAALEQEAALEAAGLALLPRLLDEAQRAEMATDTLDLARRVMARLASAPHAQGTLEADQRDDTLIAHDEAASLILGLQDRVTRDRAAEWMEHDEAGPALRLWRALARRCVGRYGDHAAAPLTLAGWVAWSSGGEVEAREALAMALGVDPEYVFARLLYQACHDGLDPEAIRRCLRKERGEREAAHRQTDSANVDHPTASATGQPTDTPASPPVGTPDHAPPPPHLHAPGRPDSRSPNDSHSANDSRGMAGSPDTTDSGGTSAARGTPDSRDTTDSRDATDSAHTTDPRGTSGSRDTTGPHGTAAPRGTRPTRRRSDPRGPNGTRVPDRPGSRRPPEALRRTRVKGGDSPDQTTSRRPGSRP